MQEAVVAGQPPAEARLARCRDATDKDQPHLSNVSWQGVNGERIDQRHGRGIATKETARPGNPFDIFVLSTVPA